MKTYIYKVYDTSGNYISTLDDVISDPSYSADINSAGSEMTLTLARAPDNYEEGTSIAFGNTIKIYVKKSESEAEALFFQGKITRYVPVYQDVEGVQVTLYSLGANLNDFVYKEEETAEQEQATGTAEIGIGSTHYLAQSFIPDQPTFTSVDVKLWVDTSTNITMTVRVDNGGEPNATAVTNGTVQKTVTNTSAQVINFSFSTPPTLTTGETYWLVLEGATT